MRLKVQPTHEPPAATPIDGTTGPARRTGRTTSLVITSAVVAVLTLVLAACSQTTEPVLDAEVPPVPPSAPLPTDATPTPKEAPTTPIRPTAPVDELVVTHGARLHVRCEGTGASTVLLIAGFEASSETWASVQPTIAQRSRVCSYDKFGTGTSDAPPSPQTFATQAEDLRNALRSLGDPGPFVVVGHSFGGSEAITFAAMHRSEVKGVVLVDASPSTWQSAACAVTDDGSPGAQGFEQVCAMTSSPTGNVEHLDGPAAFAEVGTIDTLGDLPMAVLTAAAHERGLGSAQSARLDEIWSTGQARWASLSSASRLVSVDGTGHNIQIDKPAAVIEQIERLSA
jgi:pimeloyl-ACP methyl ester carboxylesterase